MPETAAAPTVRVEVPAAGVRLITIDRPPANALDQASVQALAEVLDASEADATVRCVVLTGSGAAFTAGADLREEGAVAADARLAFLANWQRVLSGVAWLRVPVVAAINGACMGGGLELALACDFRLAATSATFCASGVRVGLIASVATLPWLIGAARAKAMLLSGSVFDAATMEQWGVVTGVHAPGELRTAALALAAEIAGRAPLSVERTKDFVNRVRDLRLDEALLAQGRAALELMATADHREAVRAFREKRPPRFERR